MTGLVWVLSVDKPTEPAMPFPVTDEELERLGDLPTGLTVEEGEDLIACGPIPDLYVEIGDAAPRRIRVRRTCCGMPGCDCALEGWSVNRRKPVPPPAWSHSFDNEADTCACGQVQATMDHYGIP